MQPPACTNSLAQLFALDDAFCRAVQQQDTLAAAAAAVGVVKSHFRDFAISLRQAGGDNAANPSNRHGSDAGRRISDGGPGARPDLHPKDRVVINTNHKRYEGCLIGKEGTVLSVTSNGWVKVQVGSEVLDIQLRYLTPLHSRGAPMALPSSAPRGAGVNSIDRQGSLRGGVRAPALRKADVVKQVRKELTQLEEQVPWKEVQDRWRTHRRSWTRKLRQADSPRDVAVCIWEFHEHLKTDKSSGLFAAGGAWETALRDCMAAGGSTHHQLLQVWEEMRSALQAWLAEGALPGGLASLDKGTYEQAVATYAVLQEAAAAGPEFLDQVPLDQILTSQRELLALQHIIQREAASAQSRLAALAAASGGEGAAAAAVVTAAAVPLELPGLEAAGLSGGVLLGLGRLPRIRAQDAGAPSDVDTDQDAGSEATELDDMQL